MTADWKLLAGRMSDREISRRFGIGASTVRRFRLANNIPEFSYDDLKIPPLPLHHF